MPSSILCARELARQQVVACFGTASRVPLLSVAEFLGIRRSTASQLAHQRRFPVPFISENRRHFVSTAVLIEKVAADLVAAGIPAGDVPPMQLTLPEPRPINKEYPAPKPVSDGPRRPRGRPRKIPLTAAGEGGAA